MLGAEMSSKENRKTKGFGQYQSVSYLHTSRHLNLTLVKLRKNTQQQQRNNPQRSGQRPHLPGFKVRWSPL